MLIILKNDFELSCFFIKFRKTWCRAVLFFLIWKNVTELSCFLIILKKWCRAVLFVLIILKKWCWAVLFFFPVIFEEKKYAECPVFLIIFSVIRGPGKAPASPRRGQAPPRRSGGESPAGGGAWYLLGEGPGGPDKSSRFLIFGG